MLAVGTLLLLYFGGNLYWLLDKVGIKWQSAILDKPNWWMFWAVFFTWCEYAVRVVKGRLHKHVYYDTITHNLFEIESLGQKFLIACPTEEELKEYLTSVYPGMEFKIIGKLPVDSFEKTESFQ